MSPVIHIIKYIYVITLPVRMRLSYIAARICWHIFDIRRRKKTALKRDNGKRILLVVKYRLAIFYALHHIELLANDPSLSFYITSPKKMRHICLHEIGKMDIKIHYVNLWDAITSDWNLISFSHHCLGAFFHPSIPKIYIAHGLENGKKIAGGVGYVYGWKAILKDQESYYTKIFATSYDEFNIAKADKHYRAFTNKIVVTSEAMALKLLEKNQDREKIRENLGIKSNEHKVVLIMSTWGADSLLFSIGPAIIKLATKLTEKYRFFIFAHAHNFEHKDTLSILNQIKAKGIEVIDPGPSSWIPYAVAADLAVSDKTSLSLYFSLLHKPIIFTHIEEEEFVEGTPFIRLYNVSPKLLAPEDLESQIEKCLQSDYASPIKLFAEQTFPRINQKDHLKSVIYQCIKNP
ncbi:MAG: CDP-glycerol glycerophosphotransferase family protein [Thermodesulfobacteriota bacterium]|nr:CDP-glycerol glycerophosphotransferase family protein [Thermodesulfobacteriota bacterium]